MSEEIEVLKQVCKNLENADLPYMLTGSFAGNFYAVPRMTRDIDIVIEIFQSDCEKIYQVFKNDFYIDKDAISDAIKQHGMFNIIHNESVFKVDFIIRKDSEYRRTEFQRKQRAKFDENEIWIVSPEDLIISKLYWAKDSFSEMQIKDVKNLQNSLVNLDTDYIKKWVHILELKSIYQQVESDG